MNRQCLVMSWKGTRIDTRGANPKDLARPEAALFTVDEVVCAEVT